MPIGLQVLTSSEEFTKLNKIDRTRVVRAWFDESVSRNQKFRKFSREKKIEVVGQLSRIIGKSVGRPFFFDRKNLTIAPSDVKSIEEAVEFNIISESMARSTGEEIARKEISPQLIPRIIRTQIEELKRFEDFIIPTEARIAPIPEKTIIQKTVAGFKEAIPAVKRGAAEIPRALLGSIPVIIGEKAGLNKLKDFGQNILDNMTEPGERFPRRTISGPTISEEGISAMFDPQNFIEGVASILPSFLFGFGVGILTKAALPLKLVSNAPKVAKAIQMTSAGLSAGALEGGPAFEEARRLGATDEQASTTGLTVMMTSGFLNILSFGTMFNKISGLKKGSKAVLNAFVEAGTEYLEEPTEAGILKMQGLIDKNEFVRRVKDGAQVILPSLLIGGASATMGSVARIEVLSNELQGEFDIDRKSAISLSESLIKEADKVRPKISNQVVQAATENAEENFNEEVTEMKKTEPVEKATRRDLEVIQDAKTPEEGFKLAIEAGNKELKGVDKKKSKLKRIPPSPLTEQVDAPQNLNKIIFDAGKSIGKKIFIGKPEGRGLRSLGSFNPRTTATIIKYAGDLDVAAHEIGHAIDNKFGVLPQDSQFDKELRKLWKFGSKAPSKLSNEERLAYRRGEGVAEWLRAYVVNPEAATEAAPRFTEFFFSKIPAGVTNSINEFSKQVRTFVGASAHDKIMSNVRWRPPGTGINAFVDWITGGKSIEGPGFQLTFWDKVNAAIVNDQKAFNKAVDHLSKGTGELLPENDPRIMARLFLGIHGKMDAIFENGMIDTEGNTITKPLSWLWEPLDKTDMQILREEQHNVATFMIAERTAEKFDQQEIAEKKKAVANLMLATGQMSKKEFKTLMKSLPKLSKRLAGIGGGIQDDPQVAFERVRDIMERDPRGVRIIEAAKRYRDWADAGLRYMRDSGRLAANEYQQIKDKNAYYTAMQRINEIAASDPEADLKDAKVVVFKRGPGGQISEVAIPIKKFTGSTKQILNPYVSLMENTYKMVRESDRNNIMVQFSRLLEKSPDPTIGRKASAGDPNVVKIFKEGKVENWQFNPQVLEVLKGLQRNNFTFHKAIRILPRIKRASIIYNPIFGVKNVIRDTLNRVIISRTGAKIRDLFEGDFRGGIKDLRTFGGDQAGFYFKDRPNYYKYLRSAMYETVEQGDIVMDFQKIKKGYLGVIEKSEQANRVAEYRSAHRSAIKQGLDPYNASLFAAFEARDLMDFAVAGDLTRMINEVIIFTSAGVRGIGRTVEALKDSPGRTLAKWSTYVMFPTLAMRLLIRSMDDEEEYLQLPTYQRDLFWNIKLAPGKWGRIPKPYDIGVFAGGVERTIDAARGVKNPFNGFWGTLLRTIMPIDEGDLSGPFGGVLENAANHNFFRQKNIIPPHEKKLDLDLRKGTERASRIGKGLQKALGIDARFFDNLIKNQFAQFGMWSLNMSDLGREGVRGFRASDLGLIIDSPAYNAKNVQEVMRIAGKRGWTREGWYKLFMFKIDKYFDSETSAEADTRAKDLREFAENRLPILRRRMATDIRIRKKIKEKK